jgi:tellurite resistance protein
MGTSTDRQGVPVTGSVDAITAYDRAVDHLQRFQIDMVEAATDSIDADPTFAMGHLMLAEMTLMSTDGGDHGAAQELLAAAEAIAADGSLAPRELAHLEAVRRWVAGDMAGAGQVLDQLAFEQPLDVLALFVGHPIAFFSGDAVSLRDRVGRVLPAWDHEDPRFGYLLGMHAFGLEESNLYGLSEEVGRHAVDTNANDVWGIHAVVHTYEMQGRVPEGVRYYQERWDDWAEANFLNVHNSWHYALYLLQGEEPERALAVYDRVLHHDGSEDLSLELLDASALLWRMHLDGLDVGDRWQPLAAAWARCLVPGFYPFNDMHAAMCFVAAGDQARAHELVTALDGIARNADPAVTAHVMTAEVGAPVCRAIAAFGGGDYPATVEALFPIRREINLFGGSHAQRDAVQRTLVEAARRSGHTRLARSLLAERLGVRHASTYDWRKVAQTLDADRDADGSRAAAEKADGLVSDIGAAVA